MIKAGSEYPRDLSFFLKPNMSPMLETQELVRTANAFGVRQVWD